MLPLTNQEVISIVNKFGTANESVSLEGHKTDVSFLELMFGKYVLFENIDDFIANHDKDEIATGKLHIIKSNKFLPSVNLETGINIISKSTSLEENIMVIEKLRTIATFLKEYDLLELFNIMIYNTNVIEMRDGNANIFK